MASRRVSLGAPFVGLALFLSAPVGADFVPGRVYVTKSNAECGFGGVFGRIYEFDPVTANWKLFAELPSCNLYGLEFTPDGQGLRVSAGFANVVYEVAGDGTWKVALTGQNGLSFPAGTNNLSYDAAGNLFVVNGGPPPTKSIMKYPGGQAPGSVFASSATGVTGAGGLANANDGSLYYTPPYFPGPNEYGAILRYSPTGAMTVFDNIGLAGALVVDSSDNLYASATQGLYKYEGGDPLKRSLIYNGVLDPFEAMALTPNDQEMYVLVSGISTIDLNSGTITSLAKLPPELLPSGWGYGMAVYVPEPNMLCSVLLFFSVHRRR